MSEVVDDPAEQGNHQAEDGDKGKQAGYWPEDWRRNIAGEDDKTLKQLERLASPNAMFQSYRELQRKLSSGEYKRVLPKDAAPEEISKWRTEAGIPEAPDKYELKLPEGLVVGEPDKPMVDAFLSRMHGKNATNEQASEAIAAYFDLRKKAADELSERDVAHHDETEALLREEFGGEYRANINTVKAMLAAAPGEVSAKILSARMPDGRMMANSPEVLRWLVSVARELNPTATIVPAGGDKGMAIADEIKAIENSMYDEHGKPNPTYWRDQKMQDRYQSLLTARQRMK